MADGTPVTDWQSSSSSGLNYARAAIPVPSVSLLFAATTGPRFEMQDLAALEKELKALGLWE